VQRYTQNFDIVSLGQVTDQACLVVDGLVGRFGQISEGHRQITALHIPGDMCDLHSVVSPKVEWALQALSAATIMRIPHREIKALTSRYPTIAEALWRDCVVDASILSQWVVNTGRRDAKMRLAHLACEMGVRMESAGLGTRSGYSLPMTQAQLADALGLTPVHVNRMVAALKSDAVVTFAGRTVVVQDWQRLTELADFDPGYLLIEKLD